MQKAMALIPKSSSKGHTLEVRVDVFRAKLWDRGDHLKPGGAAARLLALSEPWELPDPWPRLEIEEEGILGIVGVQWQAQPRTLLRKSQGA